MENLRLAEEQSNWSEDTPPLPLQQISNNIMIVGQKEIADEEDEAVARGVDRLEWRQYSRSVRVWQLIEIQHESLYTKAYKVWRLAPSAANLEKYNTHLKAWEEAHQKLWHLVNNPPAPDVLGNVENMNPMFVAPEEEMEEFEIDDMW